MHKKVMNVETFFKILRLYNYFTNWFDFLNYDNICDWKWCQKLEIICKLGRVLCRTSYCPPTPWGTAAAAPPPFRPGNPALCGSLPLVTLYYCRLEDLLCFVFMFAYCMFDLSVYYLLLQYFDRPTVGWVFDL